MRKKDSFWEYAEDLGGRFKCKFCERNFAGGIARVKSHLSGIKGRDVEICTQVPEDVQVKAIEMIGGSSNKRSRITTTSGSQVDECGNISTSSHSGSKSIHQTTMPHAIKKMDKSVVDNLLAKMFVLNNIAFNVVQSQSFIDYSKAVAEFGPTYKIPSYSTLRTKLVPESKKPVDEYIELVKKSWVKTGCTIMSDTWTDIKGRCFINIIAYSPGGAVMLKSVDISKERKTGLFLKELVSSVIESIGPQNVVQFITDNASNFEAAGNMLIGKYPGMYKTNCAAHGMQLLLKDINDDIQWIREVIEDAKSIQAFMCRYTIVNAMVKEAIKREIKRPCATRFASNFLMLQSILDAENELRLLVASPEWRGLNYTKQGVGKKVTEIIQSATFWTQGREVTEVLEPLVRVLRLVDGDGSTAGYLYDAMQRAKEAVRHRCHNNENRYVHLWNLFEKRRCENIIHPIHAVAAFFNPAYMMSENFIETREMKDGVNFMLENLIQIEEKEDFVKQVQLYRMKTQALFTSVAMTMLKTSHPRIWWDYCGDCLPVLQKYCVRILSQPCSSSSCERNWSAWETAQTKKRNRLSPTMLDNLVYVRFNTMMMEKFSMLEVQDLQPIDLSNLNELLDYAEFENEERDEEGASTSDIDDMLGFGDLSWLDGNDNLDV